MRLKNEDEILDANVRKQIIKDINGTENKRRKAEAFRRWQVFKDRTSDFVIEMLHHQFSQETVREMSYSITNVSIVRKIINKLARVYSNGVQRVVTDNEDATVNVQKLEKKLQFNKKMKTLNRMLKLQKNTIGYMKPCPYIDKEGEEKMRVRVSPMNPYLYDVVEELYDRTEALVYILSDYAPSDAMHSSIDAGSLHNGVAHSSLGGNSANNLSGGLLGDGKDQTIADNKNDEGEMPEDEKIYIWWSDKYHFTTRGSTIIDKHGNPVDISGIDDPKVEEFLINPIEEKPMVNYAIEGELDRT
jgi:hypothetical protein